MSIPGESPLSHTGTLVLHSAAGGMETLRHVATDLQWEMGWYQNWELYGCLWMWGTLLAPHEV